MPHLLPFRSDADRAAVARTVRLAFGGTPEGVADWMKLGGDEHYRVLPNPDRPDQVAACLLRIPMGTFLGGRSVPLLGVAGVGVAPENRGLGFAKRLMQGFLRDAHDEGWPLAGLYASTHTLYRAVGFEHALHRFGYTVPLGQIDAAPPQAPGPLHPLTDADDAAVRACYAAFASRFDGMLDRGPYIWSRTRKMRDMEYTGFAVPGAAGALDGYVMIHQARRPDGRHDVVLSDFCFLTPAAGRRLLALLADFSMMGHDLIFFGGPTHPALTLLRQQRYKVELKDSGLLRVLDVKRTLEARGYPAGLSTTLHLDVADELLPSNAGRWTLTIAGGQAAVERGGPGTVRTTIRGLATILTGYATPLQAKLTGEVDGADDALAAAGAAFTGSGVPWMCDMY